MTPSFKKGGISILLLALMLAISACSSNTEAPADSGDTVTNSSEAQTEAAAEETTEGGAKLNLNTVEGDELLSTIPDFGNRMVREFHEYRPYISIQQFRQEIGKYVDEAQVAAYEQYVYVPVNVNDSDAETLKQLPGVDDAIAEALMATRPYETNAAFLEALEAFVSAEDAAAAEAFLEAE